MSGISPVLAKIHVSWIVWRLEPWNHFTIAAVTNLHGSMFKVTSLSCNFLAVKKISATIVKTGLSDKLLGVRWHVPISAHGCNIIPGSDKHPLEPLASLGLSLGFLFTLWKYFLNHLPYMAVDRSPIKHVPTEIWDLRQAHMENRTNTVWLLRKAQYLWTIPAYSGGYPCTAFLQTAFMCHFTFKVRFKTC